jgi:hypothetical protein
LPRGGGGGRKFDDLPPLIQERVQQVRNSPPKPVHGGGDNSNTQFAALALWTAQRYGLPVDQAMARLEARFRQAQNPDG